jgi:hypothetical protein
LAPEFQPNVSTNDALCNGNRSGVLCGGCNRTPVSAYYDTDTTRPWTDLHIRPAMMLGAATLEAAQTLIARGLAAGLGDANAHAAVRAAGSGAGAGRPAPSRPLPPPCA